MPVDILAKYRGALALAPETGSDGQPRPYKAFNRATEARRRFSLRRPGLEDYKLPYSHLTLQASDTWANIYLEWKFLPLIVRITGEFLTDLDEALGEDEVSWIQVFDERMFQRPPEGEPVVYEAVVMSTPEDVEKFRKERAAQNLH